MNNGEQFFNTAGGGGYAISRSLRFNSSDSAYLSRTPASAGNRKTWTWAGWVKRSKIGGAFEWLFSVANSGASNTDSFFFGFDDDQLYAGSNSTVGVYYNPVFRDASAWMHVQLAVDTNQGTASDRYKLYVNGSRITAVAIATYPGSGDNTGINRAAAHYIGSYSTSNLFNGYLADIHFIDGQALNPTSFGEFDDNGIWQPIAYSGSYGTNGFHLDFADNSTAAALGTDTSGRGNTWTVNNLSVQGSRSYISNVTGTFAANRGAIKAFNGATSGTDFYAQPADGTTVTFGSLGITGITKLRMWLGKNSSGDPWGTLSLNGTSVTSFLTANYPSLTATGQWIDLTSQLSGSSLNTITMTSPASNEDVRLAAVEVNDVVLIDQTAPVASAGNDSLVDVPTNGSEVDTGAGGQVRGNYCTWNPISGSTGVVANGNLDTSNAGTYRIYGTVGVISGKFYWEHTIGSIGSGAVIGISSNPSQAASDANRQGYYSVDGNFYNDTSSTAYGSTYTTGDVVGVAYDADTGKLYFSKNGTWQNSGNPATGTNPAVSGLSGTFWPFATIVSCILNSNFGQRPFAYPLSGFKALCTANLPAPLITKPSTVMDVALWTGNGSTQSITTAFSPDFVWIKSRSASGSHNLFDTVRGATNLLETQNTDPETTNATATLTSFNSGGFSLSSSTRVNGNGTTYAGWCWDAGSSTVTNTQGSITSSVRTNNYLSVVTYTGTGANATIGHGLGTAPSFIIVKNRSSATNWRVYHSALGNTKAIFLSTTGASDTSSVYWNNTSPTSTVFSVGSDDGVNGNGNSMVAYLFSPVVGYSSFGSYTGNGSSSDGAFVYTGFRSRFILIKGSSVTNTSWMLIDSARNTYNIVDDFLEAQSSAAESTANLLDITSNGFKIKAYTDSTNQNNQTYVWAAFAESPFQYARAR